MPYIVSSGKAITSKKGILGPDTEVTPEILGHKDTKTMEELVKKGILEKVSAKPGPKSGKKDEPKDEPMAAMGGDGEQGGKPQ